MSIYIFHAFIFTYPFPRTPGKGGEMRSRITWLEKEPEHRPEEDCQNHYIIWEEGARPCGVVTATTHFTSQKTIIHHQKLSYLAPVKRLVIQIAEAQSVCLRCD